jgi:hypothetical protein
MGPVSLFLSLPYKVADAKIDLEAVNLRGSALHMTTLIPGRLIDTDLGM